MQLKFGHDREGKSFNSSVRLEFGVGIGVALYVFMSFEALIGVQGRLIYRSARI